MAIKGIWIPIEIMNDNNLNHSQKFILAEIEQLSQLESGCYAQNSHFAGITGISKVTVSKSISGLKDMGYINIQVENGSRNHVRIITLKDMITHKESLSPPLRKFKTPIKKVKETKENKHINKHINIQEGVSEKAFNLWCEYKGKKYSDQAKTLSQNKLKKYDKSIQLEMVENSIMNTYTGLIEPKKNHSQQKSTNPTYDAADRYFNGIGKNEHIEAQICTN